MRGKRDRRVTVDAGDLGTDLKEVLISEERLHQRVTELAAQIDADYAGRDLLLVGVLKGAIMIMADLARAMHLPVQMDWMGVPSHGSGPQSSGVVRILKDLETDISGRDVLIVEDIIDSGLTLSWLVGNLQSRGPASVRGCTLLRKPGAARARDVDVTYTGFDIGDDFVIGYGLDYAERYRNLPFIGTLAPHAYGAKRTEPQNRCPGKVKAGGPAGGRRDVRLVRRERPLAEGVARRWIQSVHSGCWGCSPWPCWLSWCCSTWPIPAARTHRLTPHRSSRSSTMARSSRRRSPTRTRPSR